MMGREGFPIEWVEPEKLAVFDLSVNLSFMCRHLCFLLIAWLVSVPSSSIARESEDAGLWTSVSGTGSLEEFARLGDRWLWSIDVHARFQDATDGFAQSLLRPAVGIELGENVSAWLGYAWIRTNRRSGSEFDEHRIWQQLSWRIPVTGVRLASRTRLEQRVVRSGDTLAYRVRERIRLDLPLVFFPGLDFVLHDELFLGVNEVNRRQNSGFDQNRFFAGVGFDLGRGGRLRGEVGYLNQYVQPESGFDQVNHILSVNLVVP
jgi:hypothetical protein